MELDEQPKYSYQHNIYKSTSNSDFNEQNQKQLDQFEYMKYNIK